MRTLETIPPAAYQTALPSMIRSLRQMRTIMLSRKPAETQQILLDLKPIVVSWYLLILSSKSAEATRLAVSIPNALGFPKPPQRVVTRSPLASMQRSGSDPATFYAKREIEEAWQVRPKYSNQLDTTERPLLLAPLSTGVMMAVGLFHTLSESDSKTIDWLPVFVRTDRAAFARSIIPASVDQLKRSEPIIIDDGHHNIKQAQQNTYTTPGAVWYKWQQLKDEMLSEPS